MSLDHIWKAKEQANTSETFWRNRLEQAKILLVQTQNESELLKMLNPKVVGIENSITGAIKLEIEFDATPNLRIFDNVPAVIDGSIRVLLSIGEKPVGFAICTLDYSGTSRKHTAKCICTNASMQSSNYDISFVPHHLWVVEKH